MVVEGSDSDALDGFSAPGHTSYVELVLNRCQKSVNPSCDENLENLDREMRKIHFVLTIVGQ